MNAKPQLVTEKRRTHECSKLLGLVKVTLFYGLFLNVQKASDENGKTSPWTCLAKFKLQVEDELKSIEGYVRITRNHFLLSFDKKQTQADLNSVITLATRYKFKFILDVSRIYNGNKALLMKFVLKTSSLITKLF